MSGQVWHYSLPKIGESSQSIQDRSASNPEVTRVAIADGAGSSLYPKQWAEILVESFCAAGENPIAAIQHSHLDWLLPLQEQWRQYYLQKLQDPQRSWWAGGSQLKNRGSATFLGVHFPTTTSEADRCWQAVAVGDSCLFHWEYEREQLRSFPLETAAAFKRTAKCFESLPEHPSFPPRFAEGTYAKGDRFFLATDALARWILLDWERQGVAWKQLLEVNTQTEFERAIAELRANGEIANDDTTFVLVRPD